MDIFRKRLAWSGILMFGLPLLSIPSAFAAKPINLAHQKLTTLQSFISAPAAGTEIREISRSVSKSNTLHIRVQQMYSGYKVWGADAVIHVPNSGKAHRTGNLKGVVASANNQTTMNGTLYQSLQQDLAKTRQFILDNHQADKAMSHAVATYTSKMGVQPQISDKKITRVVFVDKSQKAHWSYLVSFHADAIKTGALPAKPNYIMDAQTFQVYAEWNNIKTIGDDQQDDQQDGWPDDQQNSQQDKLTEVDGGGFGGNRKMGKLVYDGLEGKLHYAKLLVSRDVASKTCFMDNSDVVVRNYRSNKVMSFKCSAEDKDHASLFWDGDQDAVNEGYSPSNDALFGGNVIKGMYRDWYNVPVLTENDGKPMKLTMVVHDPIDNAYWDGRKMTFGDGVSMFYPLTSLGVASHEISHGFTEQHSGLAYYGHSGGMNEAFSDMAAQAAEFYAYGKNSWQIGPEIFKAENEALRYMDKPSKDCGGKEPGSWCSIDNAEQYYSGLDVHFSSGVFNRAFYLMGTAEGWDARKAFDVMVHANENYWTSTSSFNQGACGVLAAAKDLGYDQKPVKVAFETVKVDTSDC